MKLMLLLEISSTVTTTEFMPGFASDGIYAPMDLASQVVTVAGIPLKVTLLEPWESPKNFP